jgi:putative DNA primase/helicase
VSGSVRGTFSKPGERRGRKAASKPTGPTEPIGPNGDGSIITVRAGQEHVAAAEGMQALIAVGADIFQRDGELVRPVLKKAADAQGRDILVPGLRRLEMPVLRAELARAAHWQRYTSKDEAKPIYPPKDVVELIHSWAGEWPFRVIGGVIATQTMRADGSLLLAAGYDPQTKLYLMAPPAIPEIPEAPTKADALAALALLNSLLSDFPFNEAESRSCAVSMMLTPVLRGALGDAVPLHYVTAPMSGSGKSFLLDTAAAIALGERCPVYSAEADDPKETRKSLQAAALDGFPVICLDNLNGVLTGDFLAQLSERPTMKIRQFNTLQIVTIANTFTVFANGNNITATQDLVRRTIRCALDAGMENPEERAFATDPVETVLANRGPYVAACLTIARAFLVADPAPKRKLPLPSYAGWSNLVRSALCWLNWADPCASIKLARTDDPARRHRRALFNAWKDELRTGSFLVGDLVKLAATSAGGGWVYPELRAALLAVAGDRIHTELVSGTRLGIYLRNNKDTLADGLKLTVDATDKRRERWTVGPPPPPVAA